MVLQHHSQNIHWQVKATNKMYSKCKSMVKSKLRNVNNVFFLLSSSIGLEHKIFVSWGFNFNFTICIYSVLLFQFWFAYIQQCEMLYAF